MKRYYYDLHIHSALSPCCDDDCTPNNILGMASLSGLDIVALTDHNSCKNCPAFFEASEDFPIIPVAGMELTTSEDIHVVCLFEKLCDAMDFDRFVDCHRQKIQNNTKIFGNQLIFDKDENVIATEEFLLSCSSDISIDDVQDIVGKAGGVAFPSHIDREANGIISILGTVPESIGCSLVEISNYENAVEYRQKYGLFGYEFISNSDSHSLGQIKDKEFYFELDSDGILDKDGVRHALFEKLRNMARGIK